MIIGLAILLKFRHELELEWELSRLLDQLLFSAFINETLSNDLL